MFNSRTATKASRTIREANTSLIPAGARREELMINTSALTSGQRYQRSVNTPASQKFIKEAVENFDPNKVEIIKVSYRDGKFYTWDGQHTIAILVAKNGGKDLDVKCEVFYGLTEKQEAELYASQFAKKKAFTSYDDYKGRLAAEDKVVVGMVRACEKAGVELGIDVQTKKKNRIVAVRALEKMYNTIGEVNTTRAIKLLKDTYNGDSICFNKSLIGGMTKFMEMYKNDILDELFVRRLRRIDPYMILAQSNTDAISKDAATKVAKVIFNGYNYKTMKNRLISKFSY